MILMGLLVKLMNFALSHKNELQMLLLLQRKLLICPKISWYYGKRNNKYPVNCLLPADDILKCFN